MRISIMTYKFHRNYSCWYIVGTKSRSLRNSLSLWHCICIWHSMGFRWNEGGPTIFTWSYMNAMHQSNPLSASLVTRVTDWEIVVTLVLQCQICAGVRVFISGNLPPVHMCVYQAWKMMSRAYLGVKLPTEVLVIPTTWTSDHNTGGKIPEDVRKLTTNTYDQNCESWFVSFTDLGIWLNGHSTLLHHAYNSKDLVWWMFWSKLPLSLAIFYIFVLQL